MLEGLLRLLKEELGDNLLSVILFGSYVFSEDYNDVDVIVITRKKVGFGEKFEIERKFWKIFEKKLDIFPFTYDEFIGSLDPESFLSELVLGYKIIYDKVGIEGKILDFFKELAKTQKVLVTRHGIFNLRKLARVKVRNSS